MANKENKIMSVVTVPLITEKWQEDVLQKRFELCRKIYNNMLHYEIKQLNKALHDKRYVEAKKLSMKYIKLMMSQKRNPEKNLLNINKQLKTQMMF